MILTLGILTIRNQADYIRNGSAKAVMSLGKADSDSLWRAVETRELSCSL